MRRLFATTLALALAAPAAADDAGKGGIWQGSYDCSQGETLLRVTVAPEKDGERLAHFYFYPRRDATDRSSGCFSMTGRPIPGQQGWYLFTQKQWITRPPRYVMVDMIGRIDGDGGFEGRVVGPGCSRFRLRKVLDAADFAEACSPMSQ
jgi:hypothetical protein